MGTTPPHFHFYSLGLLEMVGTDGVGHFNPQGALSQHRGANSLLRWVLLRSRCQFSLLDHQTLHSHHSRDAGGLDLQFHTSRRLGLRISRISRKTPFEAASIERIL